jgi:hypothetical protein
VRRAGSVQAFMRRRNPAIRDPLLVDQYTGDELIKDALE